MKQSCLLGRDFKHDNGGGHDRGTQEDDKAQPNVGLGFLAESYYVSL